MTWIKQLDLWIEYWEFMDCISNIIQKYSEKFLVLVTRDSKNYEATYRKRCRDVLGTRILDRTCFRYRGEWTQPAYFNWRKVEILHRLHKRDNEAEQQSYSICIAKVGNNSGTSYKTMERLYSDPMWSRYRTTCSLHPRGSTTKEITPKLDSLSTRELQGIWYSRGEEIGLRDRDSAWECFTLWCLWMKMIPISRSPKKG